MKKDNKQKRQQKDSKKDDKDRTAEMQGREEQVSQPQQSQGDQSQELGRRAAHWFLSKHLIKVVREFGERLATALYWIL